MIDGKIEGLKLSIVMFMNAIKDAQERGDMQEVARLSAWLLVYQVRLENRKRELGGVWN